MEKKAILVVNVGTPDAPDIKSVRRYLREFLNDSYVIDLPWLLRKVLVNLIIIPARVRRSTSLYRRLWTAKGSPLLLYLEKVVARLADLAGEGYYVVGAMRYGNPSLNRALLSVREKGIKKLVVLPLYPHYTYSTTETLKEYLRNNKLTGNLELSFVEQFYYTDAYIRAVLDRLEPYNIPAYDHLVFSYHGLPLRQVRRVHPGINIETCNCENEMPGHGRKCYRAACYETTRLLAGRLGLSKDSYTTSFQSRLSRNWLEPFTDSVIQSRAAAGDKSILLIAPSFTADCLETSIEIGHEYRELFYKNGGENFDLAESLNDSDIWVESIMEILGEAEPFD